MSALLKVYTSNFAILVGGKSFTQWYLMKKGLKLNEIKEINQHLEKMQSVISKTTLKKYLLSQTTSKKDATEKHGKSARRALYSLSAIEQLRKDLKTIIDALEKNEVINKEQDFPFDEKISKVIEKKDGDVLELLDVNGSNEMMRLLHDQKKDLYELWNGLSQRTGDNLEGEILDEDVLKVSNEITKWWNDPKKYLYEMWNDLSQRMNELWRIIINMINH